MNAYRTPGTKERVWCRWVRCTRLGRALAILLAVALSGCRSTTQSDAQAGRQETPAPGKTGLGPHTPLTVVPVVVAGKPSKDIADVLGLMLEREGMDHIASSAAAFEPPADATLEQQAAAFGEFIRKNPVGTDHALFAEFKGTPGVGVDELRAVLADRQGRVLWSDRQTPQDPDFKRSKPREPMECCMLLVQRLGPQFGLSEQTRTEAQEGSMAALWAEKSGLPYPAELSALPDRQKQMKKSIATARLLVYPLRVNGENSPADAARLAELLTHELKCQVTVGQQPLEAQIAPSSNEQRRLWDLARAFRDQVRRDQPAADYLLIADYLLGPPGKPPQGVHFVVCDRAGQWVIVDFQNSHQADFKRLAPKSAADCDKLVAERLKGYVK